MRAFALSIFLLLSTTLGATDLRPWFGEDLWLEMRITNRLVTYNRIASDDSWVDLDASNHYAVVSGSFAADDWLCAELELGSAQRDCRSTWMDFDHLAMTVRYWAMNDIAGDPVALIIGATVLAPHKSSIRDFATLYHGDINGEIHVSLGKEWACGPCWQRRAWLVGGLGLANRGKGWWRGQLGLEQRLNACGWLGAHLWAQGGFGDNTFDPSASFGAYGDVNYRAVDLGAQYTRDLYECGEISAGYYNRVEAKNCPHDQHTFFFSFLWRVGVI